MPAEHTTTPKAVQLRPTMEGLGVVLAFVCRSKPYSDFRASKIIAAVQHQLTTGCHVCLIANEQLVAYAGWLPVEKGEAERWMKGNTNLHPVDKSETDTAALTIVSVKDGSHVGPLFRACRKIAPQTIIYFKRDYAGGRSRKAKVIDRRR